MSVTEPSGGASRQPDGSHQLAAFERLYELIARLNGQRTLDETLQAVVGGVVEGLGFGVAVVNQVMSDRSFEVVAVAGPESARRKLLGLRRQPDAFDADWAVAEHWGGLRYVPHDRLPANSPTSWVPAQEDVAPCTAPDAWHPLDALFAPLMSSSGELVGMLSVDLPSDGRLPGPLQRKLLEMFASQAGNAIDNARLNARLKAEHDMLVRERELLLASEQSFRLAFDGAGVGMAIIGLAGDEARCHLRVNAAMCAITGYPASDLVAMTFDAVTHPDDQEASRAAFDRSVTTGDPVYREEKRFLRPDGTVVWGAVTTSIVRLKSGELLYGICQVEDITTRKAADAELARRASRDPLTGLLNRTALHDVLGDAVARARSGGRGGGLLFCDLDGFKTVNDTHGHDVGDELLVTTANRLVEQTRGTDTVARLGGDEFVILTEMTDADALESFAERIERALARPMNAGDVSVSVTVSIGIALLGAGTSGVDSLMRAADTAMYAVKAAGRDGHSFAADVTGERRLPSARSDGAPMGSR